MKVFLDSSKNFYKANLHCHSVYSDGKLTVEELKKRYKEKGYSIVAFTDHEHLIDNTRLDDEDFLTITSCEIAIKEFPTVSTGVNQNMKVVHLNFYAKDPHNIKTPCYSSLFDTRVNDYNRDLIWQSEVNFDRVYSGKGVCEIIDIANKEGFLVSYNHPTWSLESALDYAHYNNLFAVEIYNHSCMRNGLHDDETAFDTMLRLGKKIYCTACDDNHNSTGEFLPLDDSFGGWVMINADKLEYTTVMNALENGDFYASTGAEIFDITYDEGVVSVKTGKAKKITYIARSRRSMSVCAGEGEFVDSAKFPVKEQDGYFRIRVESEKGMAYSQAFEI